MGAALIHSGITLPRPTRTPLRSVYRGPVVNRARAGTRAYTTPPILTGVPIATGTFLGPTFTTSGPLGGGAPRTVPTAPAVPATAPAAAPRGAPTSAPTGPAAAAPVAAPAAAPVAAPMTGLVATTC